MAIKVIKHGKKPALKKVCSVCGCEFEFDVSDLQEEYCLNAYPSYKRRYIVCPDCGEKIFYDTVSDPIIYPQPYYPTTQPLEPWWPNKPYVTWTSTKSADPCKDCPYKDGLKDTLGNPVVGDSPCDWCYKNPNKWTCINTNTSDYNTAVNSTCSYNSSIADYKATDWTIGLGIKK